MRHRRGSGGRWWACEGRMLLVGLVLGLLGAMVPWASAGEGPQEIPLTPGGAPTTLPPGVYKVGDAIITVPAGTVAQVSVDTTGAGHVKTLTGSNVTVQTGGVSVQVPAGTEIAARTNPATGRTDVVTLEGTTPATVRAGDAEVAVPTGAGVGAVVNAVTGAATLEATGTGDLTVTAIGTDGTTRVGQATFPAGTIALVDSTAPAQATIVVAQGTVQVGTTAGGGASVPQGQQVTFGPTSTGALPTTTAATIPQIPALTSPLPTLAGPGGGPGGKGGGAIPSVVAFRETPVSPFQ